MDARSLMDQVLIMRLKMDRLAAGYSYLLGIPYHGSETHPEIRAIMSRYLKR